MPGTLSTIIIRNRKTGEGLKYSISDEWLPTILGWNKLDPAARFDSAMAAERLFQSEPAPSPVIKLDYQNTFIGI